MSLQNLSSTPSTPSTLKSPTLSYPDLPSDPKGWSPSHVASYLTYCLHIYPPAIVSDLSRFIEEDATLTGRKFLRLKEEQLRQMNFNERWVKLIMVGVKALRREHLKDKILLNGGDVINEEIDEIKIIQESDEESGEEQISLTRNSFGRNSSYSSTSTIVSNNDLKDFLVPKSFSNLTYDDKKFISQEFNKLKEFLKSDNEKEGPHDKNFNELGQIVEKVLSNIETIREDNNNVKESDSKLDEVGRETSRTTSSVFSFHLSLFNWLWTKKMVFESGFVQGVMIGSVAAWAFMRFSK